MSACRFCGAPIRWARTERGVPMPLNAQPDPSGNIVVREGVAVVLRAADTRHPGERVYMPHRATCPQAVRGRRPRKHRDMTDEESRGWDQVNRMRDRLLGRR